MKWHNIEDEDYNLKSKKNKIKKMKEPTIPHQKIEKRKKKE